MKKKTVWSLLLALAMTVTAIGASTAAFAAAPNQAEPQTLIATENEDAIWDQIEALEEKSDAVFQRNEALWDKVDEACNALPDDYDFENFDEAAFIRNMTTLTEAEKETLLNDIKELNDRVFCEGGFSNTSNINDGQLICGRMKPTHTEGGTPLLYMNKRL